MNPVFFPFTFLAEPVGQALWRRFGRFALYAPIAGLSPPTLGALASEGIIDLRHPVSGDEPFLVNLCRSFKSWGALHQGETARLKRLADSGFYNEAFAAEIRSEVLKGEHEEDDQKLDPVVNARMFLQLAQEFDARQAEIALTLASTDKAARRLFEELKGEGAASGPDPFSGDTAEDAGAFMTGSRMTAWALLIEKDEMPPGMFLTTSPAVIDLLSDRFPELEPVLTFNTVPGQNGDHTLAEWIEPFLGGPWPGRETLREKLTHTGWTEKDGFALDLFVLPEHSPESIPRGFLDLPLRSGRGKTDVRHTVIGCLVPGK